MPITKILSIMAIASLSLGCPPLLSPNADLTAGLTYGMGYFADTKAQSGFSLKELLFDLIEPNDIPRVNRPAILMIHGGGFDGGSRDDEDLVAYADQLASEGYVCFLIDYRLLGDPPPAPPSFDIVDLLTRKQILDIVGYEAAIHASYVDAKTAMRHIRANANHYGIDPNRIAVMGESAGAFAAFAVGITDADDFASDGPEFPVSEANNSGINATPSLIIDFWGSADLLLDEFDSNDPPIMIFHGFLDIQFLTFYTAAQNIATACEERAIPHELYTVLEGHGPWDAKVGGKSLAELSLDFLKTHMP